MQPDVDASSRQLPLDYAEPVRVPHRVAKVVFWCCFYVLGAVVLITWLGVTVLVLLDRRVLQLCCLAFVVAAVLHATRHARRFLGGLVFLLIFGLAVFVQAATHVAQLGGVG